MTIIGFDNFGRGVAPVAFANDTILETPNTITIVRDTSDGREGLKQERYGVKFAGPKRMAGKKYDKLNDAVKEILSGSMADSKAFRINSYWSNDKGEVLGLKDNKFYMSGALQQYDSYKEPEVTTVPCSDPNDAGFMKGDCEGCKSGYEDKNDGNGCVEIQSGGGGESCESGYHLDEDEESETYGECIKDDNTITYVIIGGIALAAIVMFSR